MTEYDASAIAPLSEDDLTYWRQEIERAQKKRDEVADQHDWQGNLDRYVARNLKQTAGEVNVGADFRDVERKKAALFYDTPYVGLTVDDGDQPLTPPQPPPPPPMPGQPAQPPPPPPPTLASLVSVHQELLNAMLGPTEIHVKPVVHKVLLDVLAASGVGAVRVGYQATTQAVQTPEIPDPVTGLPLQPAQVVNVPIHEAWFASRVSPKALLLPADFKDTDSRYLPWIGYRWRKPVSQVRREYGLPDDYEIPTQDATKPYFYDDETSRSASATDPQVSGVYLEYRGWLRGQSKHPDVIWCLVLVDGSDVPLKHGPSPYQTVGPDGRLTPDSLTTFGIHPLWIRDLPDSAYPPSDCAVTGPLTKELNKFRTQMVLARDNARDVILVDAEKFNAEVQQKVEQGSVGRFVPVEPGALAGGVDAVMKQVASATLGREHYTANDYIERDREQILGISANQAGGTTQTERSATEVQTIQKNSEARFETERQRVLAWYLTVVRALDALVVRYGDERLATRVLGPRKGPFWAQFKAQMAGGYRYDMQIDSGKYLDVEANRRQWLQFYQMTAQDPFTNRQVLLKKLAASWGLDPAEWVVQPEPPKPPPVQAAVSLKGADFDPTLPGFPIILALARQGGWQIPDEVVAAAEAKGQQLALLGMTATGDRQPMPAPNTRHGGAAPQVAPISKRQADETGERTGPKSDV